MAEIIIVGLGPGPFHLITLETYELLKSTPKLLLRTEKHPAVSGLKDRNISFSTYDAMYKRYASFKEVYQAIAVDCIKEAERCGKVVYAVPGSPAVAEQTVALIREKGEAAGVTITVIPGMSFLDLLYVRLGVDPIRGVTVVDAADIETLPEDLDTALVVTQVYNRQVASDAKLSLMEYYPDDFEVVVVRNLGLPDETILNLPLYELDRAETIDHLTSVYIPAKKLKQRTFSFQPLVDVMAKLRSPGGCIWDIEQTHLTLRHNFIEEVYEVIEAIELEDSKTLCEELGDVLLQIVFHARMAEEDGKFSMQDVIDGVTEKLVRRHPHVFGDISVRDAAQVVLNWEDIKKQEKGAERPGVLDGVPQGLPSLMRSNKLQTKAAKVGFDWNSIDPIWDKIQEELQELKEVAGEDSAAAEMELGDVLFSVVNLARFLGLEPETALTATNNKFIRRFNYIQDQVKLQKKKWEDFTLDELDVLWNEAKLLEKA
ncbi:MAG: MazG family protein [Firmicutes bacterium]|nr:MazG family protein [Bacillota bacterium]